MYYWRVSKYNPQYRDERGVYVKNEWTSVADIGKDYEGERLTTEKYLSMEDAYIKVLISAMQEANVEHMQVKELEKVAMQLESINATSIEKDVYDSIKENDNITGENIIALIRLILREALWAKLENHILDFHFGYDYYMYIRTDTYLEKTEKLITEKGLYIENVKSPYYESID